MKKVIEEFYTLPEKNQKILSQIDFSDTFSTTNQCHSIVGIGKLIFETYPKWIEVLMNLRNRIMAVFGLKTEMPADYHEDDYIGFFKIFSQNKQELVLGMDDKHLNFRVCIINTHQVNYNIKVVTLVAYNNAFGRFYMFVIKPFHRLVVKRMVLQAFCKR